MGPQGQRHRRDDEHREPFAAYSNLHVLSSFRLLACIASIGSGRQFTRSSLR
jgi:hypothetical protein